MACRLTNFGLSRSEITGNLGDQSLTNICNPAMIWNNLTYYKKSYFGQNLDPILYRLKGGIEFATLTALMGPSGCGKTTLLRCINGANRNGLSDDSEIYVNSDRLVNPCFVEQDIRAHLFLSLTVKESLRYAWCLKNSAQMSCGSRNVGQDCSDMNRDMNILTADLMLGDCLNTRIGKCSGGEQKRIVIAMELMTTNKPNLICIDEPTTGLDSYAAEQIIDCLKRVAIKHSLSIVTSIHQPNSDILLKFSSLYVLTKGGRCVYSGPPNALRDHLLDCHIQCEEYQTPIEVLITISSLPNKIPKFDNRDAEEIVNQLSEKCKQSMATIDSHIASDKSQYHRNISQTKCALNSVNFWHLLRRTALVSWSRKWLNNLVYMLVFMMGATLNVLIVPDGVGRHDDCVDPNNVSSIIEFEESQFNFTLQNKRNTNIAINVKLAICMVTIMVFEIGASIVKFSSDMKVFMSEHRNGWYSTGSFYWSKTLAEIPAQLVTAYLAIWIYYYGSSQIEMNHWYAGVYGIPQRFSLFVLSYTLAIFSYQGMVIFFSVLFVDNVWRALNASMIVMLLNVVNSSFMSALRSLPLIGHLLSNVSISNLYFRCIIVIIYGRDRCPRSSVSLTMIKFDFDDDQLWPSLGGLLCHLFVWRLLALLVLMVRLDVDLYRLLRIHRK